MREPAEFAGRLDRMPRRMTEVEQHPLAEVLFVPLDYRRLHPATGGHDACQLLRVALPHCRCGVRQTGEKRRVENQAVFDHFRHAGGKFARWQRLQRLRIDQHPHRLVKRADQVLAQMMVHRDFAADAGIDLRQQAGGNLQEWHAAQICRSDKAGQIADHAAAQRQNRAVAVQAGHNRLGIQNIRLRQGLGRLSCRHDRQGHAKSGLLQTVCRLLAK